MAKKMHLFLSSLVLSFAHVCSTTAILNDGSFAAQDVSLDSPIGSIISSILPTDGFARKKLGSLQGSIKQDQEFDYIVAGGGTAGNAIGVRLAEAGFRVAIIEAGYLFEIAKPLLSTIPTLDIIGVGADKRDAVGTVDWEFQTEPQTGANNRRLHYARGKCLGGSSALNFMLYHRGSRGTYDRWADEVGDEKFRLDNFQKFFKKSINFTPPDTQKRKGNASTPYDIDDFSPVGHGGPVQVSYTNWVSSWSTWLEKGLKAAGVKRTRGFNQGDLLGYHYAQTTIRQSDATRSSSAEYVYFAKTKGLKTLKVFLRTHALKVLFNRQKQAIGLSVKQAGKTFTIKARREVILSAGAFQSPQLLMVSGIGPEDTLRQHRIPIVSALPGVGQNMWDHVFFGPSHAVSFPTLNDVLNHPVVTLSSVTSYVFKKSGPLTSNIIEFLGWEKLPQSYRQKFSRETNKQLAEFPDDWPEVEYLGANGYLGNFNWPIKQQPKDGKNYATILGAVVAPLSRGNVTIRSASSLDKPIINPNWMTAKGDQEVAVAWFRRMRDVWGTRELQSIVVDKEKWPGQEVKSDEEILNVVRESLMTVWHPACTCKMGKKGDKMAVVDHQARVFGVTGLRVVDASAMPLLPPGHPQSTIYALAEKIADDIIQEDKWGQGG